MNFLSSIFLGSPGVYNICGASIEFIEDPYILRNSTTSRIYNCVTQKYFQACVGTLTKALMFKLLTGKSPMRNVCAIDTGFGYMKFPEIEKEVEWKRPVVYCSGITTITNLFGIEIIAAKVISNYVPWPVTMLIVSGVSLSIFDGLYGLYHTSAVSEVFKRDVHIVTLNKTQSILITAILSAQIALGVSILSKI